MDSKTATPIRVLIADDSIFVRKILKEILDEDPEIEVVGIARNGKEALEVAGWVNPDVITLDVQMPVMDGLECLRHLMEQGSYAVVMISSDDSIGTRTAIKALSSGAVDIIKKPESMFMLSLENKKQEIIQKIKIAKTAALKDLYKKADIKKKQFSGEKASKIEKIIAIGTSTGGPKALQNVIPFLPGDLPASIVIVQHMPQGFTSTLAKRLNDLSEFTVKEAEHNEPMKPGFAYIAPGDRHLVLDNGKKGIMLRLDDSEPVSGHRPSVDKMLYSLAETGMPDIIGVIMTGMGSDGAKGFFELKKKRNIKIIAQDEKSCIVYGMPRAIVEMGIADSVIPLQQIPKEILNFMGVQR
ncbi:MAG: chemotaxis response regulator protein-glutamate methylesterase [Clostridiaceae bacterium]|nr:chemotaxis response regulator protein-glutamate methylesterase [Clostridiaceae bacterium]